MHPVKPHIAKNAHVGSREDYEKIYRRSIEQGDDFWLEQASRLAWIRPPEVAGGGGFDQVDFTWYRGGVLNACVNCVDRHLDQRGDKTAIIWAADEAGDYERITYRELDRRVGRMANVLKAHGVGRGDRVCIYLPMIPELAYTMLACARIGAIHSIVFAGFSADSLRDRIVDAGCEILVTANEGLRGGKPIPLKAICDEAVDGLPELVRTVLVARRTETEVAMRAGRDHWLDAELARQRPHCPPEPMDAEAPLYILYTSGSTGKPKGVMHTTGGYLVYASLTHEIVFDVHENDVYACVADIGWVTGHSYIIYGPLANGATTVMFESTPLYPDPGRYWRLVDDLGVTVFYTAPTAIRAVAREGDDWVKKHDRSSLRVLGTVGEPINPEVWQWYHDVVGGGRCAIVDTWWQTETGGILITPLPGAIDQKPGSATLPFFGVEPVLVDENGREIEGNGVSGNLCMRRSWPGQARTLYGDHERFRETYFSQYPGLYFTGDGCRRDEDGYYWITGRVDDVLNVSGHRLGTAEVESALVAHEAVAEAAVVGFPHEIKGTGIYAYVILKPEAAAAVDAAHGGTDTNAEGGTDAEAADAEGGTDGGEAALIDALRQKVRQVIGPIATPDRIQITPGLPKTRSGKIMRRILRNIAAAEYEDMGDITTLAEPAVVAALIERHRASTS